MNHTLLNTLLLSTLLSSAPSMAFLKLGGQSNQDLATLVGSGLLETKQHTTLINQVKNQLPISDQQAGGGVAALLALANNQLPQQNQTELNTVIPNLGQLTQLGLSTTNVSPSAMTHLKDVTNVFNQLGLDANMIAQFTPIIIQYLTSQGAGSSLVGALQSMWQ
ncbi:DUF2780 domain-containing protein [Vibrio injensis]|uniref:DUF2780 domain-containing protein n=1 Tax=Vibrio injensis TaxID=1307414 RepID=UPI00278C5B0A|nr:DUF2780 domain-containing protein [Vibrio injensis]